MGHLPERKVLKTAAVASSKALPPQSETAIEQHPQPLDPKTRSLMEARFKWDFGKVRVHTDAPANQSVAAMGARAVTQGWDIRFAEGRYAPGTSEGRRLLVHELTHVVQQARGVGSVVAPEGSLEAEASANANAVGFGRPVLVAEGAPRGQPQFDKPTPTQSPKSAKVSASKFKFGDVKLHGQAGVDVRSHGVLLPGPDQGHIAVRDDGLLGYDPDYTTPEDPFRWERLKFVVDNGQADIFAVTSTESFNVKEISGDTERIYPTTLIQHLASGLTLERKSRYLAIYPMSTLRVLEEGAVISADDGRDHIFYETGEKGRGTLGSNALAHELYGHYWLALQGVPFVHPPSLEEARKKAESRGQKVTTHQLAVVSLREKLTGTLTEKHNIKDPFGRPFTGTVREYIDRYAGASIGPLQSPTQNVGEAKLQQALTSLRQALLAPGGLVRHPDGAPEISDAGGLQWEIVSNNYEALRQAPGATPGGWTPDKLKAELLELYRTALNATQQSVFLEILVLISTASELGKFRQRQLASELKTEIRLLPPSPSKPDAGSR
jgi:hypothetical protein